MNKEQLSELDNFCYKLSVLMGFSSLDTENYSKEVLRQAKVIIKREEITNK